MTGVLILSAVAGGNAQVEDRPLRRPPSLLRPSGPPAARVETFIPVGPDSLDATYYIPPFAPPDSNGYPAMLFVHGFGGDKYWDTASAAIWGTLGYVSLCYSVRAHGNSSGLSTIMGSAERSDLAGVVEFLRSLPMVNPDRIGIQGGSQGGLHCLWAVADSLPVRAAAGDVITPCWATDMFVNGAIRHTVTFLLQTPSVRYGPDRDSLWELVRTDAYDALRQRFTTGRDVDTVRLHASRIPLATFMKWQDHYFSAQDGIESFLRQPLPRKMYLGTGGHFSDVDYQELLHQWDVIDRWLDYFVIDDSNGILDEPPVTYAASALPADEQGYFTWHRQELESWPPADMHLARFYFHGDSLLLFNPPVASNDSVTVRNEWNGIYSFDEGFIEGFKGPRFEAAIPKQFVVFESAPLVSDMQWVGPPRLDLHLRSDFRKFPLHAQIFEVDSSDTPYLVNRVNFVARDWTPGESEYVELQGIAHAHTFTRGNRIRVEITNIDDQNREGWGTTPFVVPLFHSSEGTLYMDSARASFVEFPVVGAPPLPIMIASFDAVLYEPAWRVRVEWRTLREIDVDGYYVERKSGPKEEFETLSFIPPVSGPTSHVPHTYVLWDSTVSGGPYWYRLRQKQLDGSSYRTDPVFVDVTVGVADVGTPSSFWLDQNYPNPFNPSTTIRFALPRRLYVVIQVFDLLGREVERILDRTVDAGSHTVRWDARNHAGGVYYCRITAPGYMAIRKMVLAK